MVDENLVRLSDFLYRDRGEALGALLVKYTYLWIVSVEFGGIRRLGDVRGITVICLRFAW